MIVGFIAIKRTVFIIIYSFLISSFREKNKNFASITLVTQYDGHTRGKKN